MVTDHIRGRTEADILIIEAPPRHGKSVMISEYTPAWHSMRWPEKRIILAAYEAGFARTWGRKVRHILEEHGSRFGVSVQDDQSAASDWATNAGGGMLTTGAGGPMTGRGADLLIIDDPIKNAEEAMSEVIRDSLWEWWESTASTRIEPDGKAVIIATRWHEDDLSGRIIRHSEEQGGMKVQVLTLRAMAEDDDILGRPEGGALWPQRYDEAALEKLRKSRDPYWWLAMYQQRAGRPGNAEWPDEYFEGIFPDRWPDAFECSAIGVDPSKGKSAKRGDYSAIVSAGMSGGILWVDSDIERRPTTKIVSDTLAMVVRTRAAAVNFESNGFQEVVADTFQQQAWSAGHVGLAVMFTENTTNKELRLQWKLGPLLAQKKLRFRDTPSNRLLVQQLREFPLGRHDDGPDGLEMAITALDQYLGQGQDYEISRALT